MDRNAIGGTSAKLRELLMDPPYAHRWQTRIGRRQNHDLHQSAICLVLADYLWNNGLQPVDDQALPRKLKDRVYRALNGRSLSLGTLRWFIEAFEMSPQHTASLLRLASTSGADAVIGCGQVNGGTLPPRRYRTVSVRDVHRVGPDGLPESHRTRQVIRAIEPMDRYPYVFDTDTATVRVLRGGRAGRLYAVGKGLFAVDVELDEPLRPGGTTCLELETTFWYRTPPPPVFRRAATGRVQDLQVRVQFHHLRLPARVWWHEWPNADAPPSTSEPLTLDNDKGAQRLLETVHQGLVGFRWQIARRG